MDDRNAAWAALHDPATDGATLASIAQAHPEFAEAILRHPNCYDGLRAWIVDYARPAASAPPASAATADVESRTADTSRAAAAGTTSAGRASASHRVKLIAIVAAVVIVVGGGGAWAASTFLAHREQGSGTVAGGSSNMLATLKVSGAPPSTDGLAGGAKLAWQSGGGNLSQSTASGPRTWLAVSTGPHGGSQLTGIDATSGAEDWRRVEPGVVQCAATELNDSAYCYVTAGGDEQHIEQISLADGSVRHSIPMQMSGQSIWFERIAILNGAVIAVQNTGRNGATAVVSKFPADLSSVLWSTTIDVGSTVNAPTPLPDVARVRGGVLVLSDNFADMVLDFSTGATLFSSPLAASDVLEDGTVVTAQGTGTTTTPAGSHSAIALANHTLLPVDFSASANAAPEPIYFSTQDSGTVSVAGYTADGAKMTWGSAITMAGSPLRLRVAGAVEDSHLALVDSGGHITSVDPATGAVQWANSYPMPSRATGNALSRPSPFFADADTLVVADVEDDPSAGPSTASTQTPVLHAFSASTGRKLWDLENVGIYRAPTAPGSPVILFGPDGMGPLVGTGTATTQTAAIPSGLPSCPSGMTPVSWSAYPSGHVLLCSGGSRYVADVAVDDQPRACTTVAFDAGGYTLGCAGRSTIRVAGGGAVIQFASGSAGWVQPARATWSSYYPSAETSTGFGDASGKLPIACPTGSTVISLSTWQGGWLLICGTDAAHATFFTLKTPKQTLTGTDMTFADGTFCGPDTHGAQVCAGATPAVVSITPKDGSPTKYSASANYFPSDGVGGAGKGTGAYGVAAPKDDAADQVRYLTQILQKSERGRAAVAELVANLLRCQITSADVATASSVVSNRQDLLSALTSTPVDKVSGGSRLVAELTQALRVSLQADQQYVVAAGQVLGGDCNGGLATMQAITPIADQTNPLKQTFVNDWNSTIVGRYPGAPTFDMAKI